MTSKNRDFKSCLSARSFDFTLNILAVYLICLLYVILIKGHWNDFYVFFNTIGQYKTFGDFSKNFCIIVLFISQHLCLCRQHFCLYILAIGEQKRLRCEQKCLGREQNIKKKIKIKFPYKNQQKNPKSLIIS